MGRKKGTPAYRNKTRASSFITTREAWIKLKAAERRSGKSRSDVITDCLIAHADKITFEKFEKLAAKEPAA